MFKVTVDTGERARVELRDDAPSSPSTAELAPWRGGMLTRWSVGGADLLYLDETTFANPTKNVRGGVPVLFPSPGKLAGDAWSRDGRSGTMRQHGFARELAWDVAGTDTHNGARATLRLRSTEGTRAQYPWDFTAEYGYTLRGAMIRIDQRFTNEGDEPMPFGAGFHPYFSVRDHDKKNTRVPTRARRAFDNAAKREVELPPSGIDLTATEVDLHLHDHGGPEARLERAPLPTIELRGSPELARWVIWTLAGKDFVCVEPWTCPGNALNTGDDVLVLAPGESRALWIEMSAGG